MLNTRGHKFLVLQRNCETERKTSSAFQADTSVGVDGDLCGQTYLLPCFGSTGEKVKSRPQKNTVDICFADTLSGGNFKV